VFSGPLISVVFVHLLAQNLIRILMQSLIFSLSLKQTMINILKEYLHGLLMLFKSLGQPHISGYFGIHQIHMKYVRVIMINIFWYENQ